MSKDILSKILSDIRRTHNKLISMHIGMTPQFPRVIKGERNIISSYKNRIIIKDKKSYIENFIKTLENNEFSIMLKNFDLIQVYYEFSKNKKDLIKASLIYYPNPGLKRNEDLFGEESWIKSETGNIDYLSKYMRMDFDCKESYKEIKHPCSHVHIGLLSGYRIALKEFPYLSDFVNFILFLNFDSDWDKINNITIKDGDFDFENYLKEKKKKKLLPSIFTPNEETHHYLKI